MDIKIGLYMFVVAVLLNMISSETMCSLEVEEKQQYTLRDGSNVYVRPCSYSGWRKFLVPFLALCSAISLGLGTYMDIMKVTAWFMRPR